MSVTSTRLLARVNPWGSDVQDNVVEVVLSGSYTAGGETITPASLGVSKIHGAYVVQTAGAGVHVHWDGTKLRAHRTGSAVASVLQELPNGDGSAAGTYRLRVVGS